MMFKDRDDFEPWLLQQLKNVRNKLGMETAIASFITDDTYTIVSVDSEMEGLFEAGQQFPLQDTYCRAVMQSKQQVCYNHVATIKSMLQHPVYQAVKLESYIAAPVCDENKNVMGTINFTSLYPHRPQFNSEEQQLVDDFALEVSNHFDLYSGLACSNI